MGQCRRPQKFIPPIAIQASLCVSSCLHTCLTAFCLFTSLKGGETQMLLSQKSLRSALGILWLIDGLLQLQPRMFTPNMADSILWPTIEGQPAPIAASLHSIVTVLSQHL